MNSKRGATLLELMSVVGIIGVLFAIASVVAFSAKKKSTETPCIAYLKQIHTAVSLYQSDWEGFGQYGSTSSMGLPPKFLTASIPELRKLEKRCKGESFGYASKATFPYTYMASDGKDNAAHPLWADYSQQYQGNSILAIDMNHNARNLSLFDFHEKRLGLGVTLDGALVRRFDNGDWTYKPWWNGDTDKGF